MKIAILCSGYFRSFKSNLIKLKELLLDRYDCDFYLYIISNEYESDKYINKKYDTIDLLNQYNPKVYLIEQNEYQENPIDRIKQMWFKINILNQIRKEIEVRDSIYYDRIIRIRPDLNLLLSISEMEAILKQSETKIIIPTSHNISYPDYKLDTHIGINDQFAVSNSNLMNIYCDLYNYITIYNKNGYINSSSCLLYHFKQNNILYETVNIKTNLVLKENNIITVSGDSGCGKSTFSLNLKKYLESFNNNEVLVFECDRYHKWSRGDKNWNQFTHLNPEANSINKMKDDILQLKINNTIQQIDYNHNNGSFTTPQKIIPTPIIIVSGLHTLIDPSLNFISNIKIYIDPSNDLRIKWKTTRDIQERGYTLDKSLQSIENRNEDYNLFIVPQKNNADLIISYFIDDHDTIKIILKIKKEKLLHYNHDGVFQLEENYYVVRTDTLDTCFSIIKQLIN